MKPATAGGKSTRAARKKNPRSDSDHAFFVTAMARGIAVLESFSGSGWNALGIREIAKRASLNVPAAQRAVHTLTTLGYLEKDRETARYRFFALTSAIAMGAAVLLMLFIPMTARIERNSTAQGVEEGIEDTRRL